MNKITPHKGGRTVQVKTQLTPEEKERLWQAKGDLSLADWIMQKVDQEKELNELVGELGNSLSMWINSLQEDNHENP